MQWRWRTCCQRYNVGFPFIIFNILPPIDWKANRHEVRVYQLRSSQERRNISDLFKQILVQRIDYITDRTKSHHSGGKKKKKKNQEVSTIARLENLGKESMLPDPRVYWKEVDLQGALLTAKWDKGDVQSVGNLGRGEGFALSPFPLEQMLILCRFWASCGLLLSADICRFMRITCDPLLLYSLSMDLWFWS